MTDKKKDRQPDIFDKIFSSSPLKKFAPFYQAYREQFLYILFGGLTTLISIVLFAVFAELLQWDVLVSNIVSWILSVLFAFYTNRKWVFISEQIKKKSIFKQMYSFYLGRLATLIIEELLIYLFVYKIHLNAMIVKITSQIIVIILNYLISKIYVFKSYNN